MSLYTYRGYNDVCRGKQNVYILSDPAACTNSLHSTLMLIQDLVDQAVG